MGDNSDSEKSLSERYESLNKKYNIINFFQKLLINELTNNQHDPYVASNPDILLRKIQDVVNNLQGYYVFGNQIKVTTILFLLKNHIVYMNAIKKIIPQKNINSIKFAFEDLQKREIIEPIGDDKFVDMRQTFNHFIMRNSRAGYYHIGKVKYYSLTPLAKGFFEIFVENLEQNCPYTDKVEDFKSTLSQTHKKLRESVDWWKKKLFGDLTKMSKRDVSIEEIKKYATDSIEKLSHRAIYLDSDDVEKMIKRIEHDRRRSSRETMKCESCGQDKLCLYEKEFGKFLCVDCFEILNKSKNSWRVTKK